MYFYFDTNKRVSQYTNIDPWTGELGSGARRYSVAPVWHSEHAYKRLNTGFEKILKGKGHLIVKHMLLRQYLEMRTFDSLAVIHVSNQL